MRQNKFLSFDPNGPVLDALLNVAVDRSASTEARVAALAEVAQETHPSQTVSYEATLGGLDRFNVPVYGCFRGYVSHTRAVAISGTNLARIHQMATTLVGDRSQPADVRSAAACVLQ